MKSLFSTLFSTSRSEVLRLLFPQPGTELYLREIQRASGLALRSIQLELETLLAHDLIVARRDGNRVYYRANSRHAIFPELQGLVLKTAGLADVLRDALAEVSGIKVAFIFGSVASGMERAESDVDLMVLGEIGLRPLAPLLRIASQSLNREINPHVMTIPEWQRKTAGADVFVNRVLQEPKIWLRGNEDELK